MVTQNHVFFGSSFFVFVANMKAMDCTGLHILFSSSTRHERFFPMSSVISPMQEEFFMKFSMTPSSANVHTVDTI